MQNFKLDRGIARLALLQRIELSGTFLKKLRKIFGRYIFSAFLSKYLINPNEISKNYFNLMNKEFSLIDKYIKHNNKILSIGSGVGGLEILIHKKFNNHITFIEKNYISKKVKYGWDIKNKEAYNSLKLLEKFLLNNGFEREKFNLFDFDKDKLPEEKFDIVISLYSLDYHYNFNLYEVYLKKVMKPQSLLIIDTVRPDYFKNIFKSVEVIKQDMETVHKSKRIICKNQ